MRKVWINIPAYTGQIHVPTAAALLGEADILRQRGIVAELHTELGNALIGDARAVMVEKFLEGEADDFVFLDWDVSWQPGRLAALIEKPVDFRLGIYPSRCDPETYTVGWDETRKELWADPETGLLEIWRAPLGFAVCSRGMLSQMRDAYQSLDFVCTEVKRKRVCALFSEYWMRDVPLLDGTRGNIKFGEDMAFCQRWRDLGGKVWLDPEIRFGHIGLKTFTGKLGDWLREQMKGTHEQA